MLIVKIGFLKAHTRARSEIMLAAVLAAGYARASPERPWMDATLPVDVRTDLLVNAMTAEEKMVQG